MCWAWWLRISTQVKPKLFFEICFKLRFRNSNQCKVILFPSSYFAFFLFFILYYSVWYNFINF
jgi:hypothetical protein